jgi:uncharacterized protein (DUF58 family)
VTGRGWAVLFASVVLVGTGKILGLEDLYMVGVGLLVVLAFAFVYVRSVRVELHATRVLRPAHVHAGAPCRVELAIVNRARRRSPVTSVRDPFAGGARWARFLVAPLAPGETSRAAYRVPTDQRGLWDLGPMEIGVTDPLGLMTAVSVGAGPTQLTVYPRVDAIAPPPAGFGDDPLTGADYSRVLAGGGPDFYALRPYVRGDDIRRVHWPSSAKAGELMLRQDETPWQPRSTVVLDTRVGVCRPQAFELLVSAAASILTAAGAREELLRLVTTSGIDLRGSVPDLLQQLAVVQPEGDTGWQTALMSLSGGGSLVALTTNRAPVSDMQGLGALRRFTSVTMVIVGHASVPLPGITVVEIGPDQPFAVGWGRAR